MAQAPDPFFSDANLAYVKKSVEELRAGKGNVHELIEVDMYIAEDTMEIHNSK